MREKEDKYPDCKKYYIIEYNNGESFEDNWKYPLDVVFESLDNAIDYIKSMYIEVEPQNYDKRVEKKLPDRRYYTKEERSYYGNIVLSLEDDDFIRYNYYSYGDNSFYTIREVSLIG